MNLIELHVFNSGRKRAFNVDGILDIGEAGELKPGQAVPTEGTCLHGIIKRIDGSSVEVRETYEELLALLKPL